MASSGNDFNKANVVATEQKPLILNKKKRMLQDDDDSALDPKQEAFDRYGVPRGLNKLFPRLQNRKMNFLVDNRSGMSKPSDVFYDVSEPEFPEHCIHPLMKQRLVGREEANKRKKQKTEVSISAATGAGVELVYLTRWEEIENRLLIAAEILPYLQTGTITIEFLQANQKGEKESLEIDEETRTQATPQQLKEAMHSEIVEMFSGGPSGNSKTSLSEGVAHLLDAKGESVNVIYTDGANPDQGCLKDEFVNNLNNRSEPFRRVFTIAACTDEPPEYFSRFKPSSLVVVVDDKQTEEAEAIAGQGEMINYSDGIHVTREWLAPLSPECLGIIDQKIVLSQDALSFLSFRGEVPDETYQAYKEQHPANQPSAEEDDKEEEGNQQKAAEQKQEQDKKPSSLGLLDFYKQSGFSWGNISSVATSIAGSATEYVTSASSTASQMVADAANSKFAADLSSNTSALYRSASTMASDVAQSAVKTASEVASSQAVTNFSSNASTFISSTAQEAGKVAVGAGAVAVGVLGALAEANAANRRRRSGYSSYSGMYGSSYSRRPGNSLSRFGTSRYRRGW